MSRFSFRLSHKILLIGIIGLLGLAVFGAIYLKGAASQDVARKIAEDARVLSKLNEKLARDMLDARRAEKDFLLRKDEASIKRHAAVSAKVTEALDQLAAMIRTNGFNDLAGKVGTLAGGFDEYRKRFSAMQQTEIKLGLNEKLGLSGALRASVHAIEDRLKEVDNPRLASGMLMMRRHEKDFMLRRDQTYVEAFKTARMISPRLSRPLIFRPQRRLTSRPSCRATRTASRHGWRDRTHPPQVGSNVEGICEHRTCLRRHRAGYPSAP